MKKIVSAFLAALLIVSCAGCSKSNTKTRKRRKTKRPTKIETSATTAKPETEPPVSSDPTDVSDPTRSSKPTQSNSPIKDMTLFVTISGMEISDDNEIREVIAEKTNVRLHEVYLVGQSETEAIGSIIASGDYPDMISTGTCNDQLYEAGVLIALDDYLDDPAYQNLRNYYTDAQWNLFRQSDGHIYWFDTIPLTCGEDRTTLDSSMTCFWIQVRVLEWAGYPLIETLDEYFDLLERYYNANPYNADGTAVIPYTMNTESWRYFGIEQPPMLLDGYPNNVSVIVDTENSQNPTVMDYNNTDTAKAYFRKLNSCYKKGLIDPDFASQSYDMYVAKMCSGSVLGTYDAYWDFAYSANDAFRTNNQEQYGYNYVPLGLTIKKGMENHYYSTTRIINQFGGLGITTQCQDPDLAVSFLNRCLDQDIHDLRFWGIEGTDYYIDSAGYYYRTAENMRDWSDYSYMEDHICTYTYLPSYMGTSRDNLNAMLPQEQASVFMSTLPNNVANCFLAYGYDSYTDFVRSADPGWQPWFPMYTYSNGMSDITDGGKALDRMQETKHEHLPKLVLSKDFDKAWDEYMRAYDACKPEDFLAEMQEELDRRIQAVS